MIPLSWRFSHLRRPPRPSVCHFASFPAKTWLLSSLFGVCCSVRCWRLRRRKKVIFMPSRTSLFIDVGKMPALAAIFVSDRLGFLLIFILVFFTTSWARADRGRPLLGSSSTLPFSRNFFKVRYTVVLCIFKVFEINPTVNLRRASATMASLPPSYRNEIIWLYKIRPFYKTGTFWAARACFLFCSASSCT